MIIATANPEARKVLENARKERAKVTRDIWTWMFGASSR